MLVCQLPDYEWVALPAACLSVYLYPNSRYEAASTLMHARPAACLSICTQTPGTRPPTAAPPPRPALGPTAG